MQDRVGLETKTGGAPCEELLMNKGRARFVSKARTQPYCKRRATGESWRLESAVADRWWWGVVKMPVGGWSSSRWRGQVKVEVEVEVEVEIGVKWLPARPDDAVENTRRKKRETQAKGKKGGKGKHQKQTTMWGVQSLFTIDSPTDQTWQSKGSVRGRDQLASIRTCCLLASKVALLQ